MDKLLHSISEASSLGELIEIVSRLHKLRAVATFGVRKADGVSIQKTRRAANNAAVNLLNSLPPGFDGAKLTDEQRQILAGYTGEGGLTDGEGSQYEYYTPQFWLKVYGICLLTTVLMAGTYWNHQRAQVFSRRQNGRA